MHKPRSSYLNKGIGWRLQFLAAVASLMICAGFLLGLNYGYRRPQAKDRQLFLIPVTPVRHGQSARPQLPPIAVKQKRLSSSLSGSREVRFRSNSPSTIEQPRIDAGLTGPIEPATGEMPHAPITVDLMAAMTQAKPMIRKLADNAGIELQLGVRSGEERLADSIAMTAKRDCLGPRPDLVGDLIELAIYLKTIAAGKCSGQ